MKSAIFPPVNNTFDPVISPVSLSIRLLLDDDIVAALIANPPISPLLADIFPTISTLFAESAPTLVTLNAELAPNAIPSVET